MSTNAYRHKRPHRRKRGAPLVSLLLLAALLPVLFLLLRSLNVYRKNRQFYEALNESVLLSEATPAAAQTQAPASTPALITGSVPWQDEPPAGSDGRPLFHPDVFHAVFQNENHPLVARAIGLNGELVQLLQQFLRNAQRMRRLPSSPRRLMVRGFASLMSSIVSHSVSLRNNCSLPNPGKTYNIKLS